MKTKLKTSERIGIAVILILSAVILFSCSNAKLAVKYEKRSQKWHEKAIKKGMVVKEVRREPDAYELDTNEVGKPYLRPIYYDCPPCQELVFPPSNTEIRNETKRQKNELKFNWKMYADSLETVIKLERQKTKQNKSDNKADTKQTRIIKKQETKQLNCWNWWDKLNFGVTVFIPAFILGYLVRWIIKLFKKIQLGIMSWYGNSY